MHDSIMPNIVNFSFQTPFNLVLVGASQCGKTTWLKKMLDCSEQLFNKKPGPVYYFYNVYQPQFDSWEGVHFEQGICTMQWIRDNIRPEHNATIVMDDVAKQMSADTAEIFTVASHHFNVNIVLILHNLFDRSPPFREISINSKYLCIFKNPRDQSSIMNFAKQYDPGNVRRILNIFRDATKEPYSYLFIDMDQKTSEDYRLRSNIFFENGAPLKVYKRLS